MPGGDASPSAPFVICHRDGSSDRQDLPDKQPLAQSPCIFCTLAKAPCAILPIDHGIVISPAMGISNAALQSDGRTIAFHSPTGQYQRGPPEKYVGDDAFDLLALFPNGFAWEVHYDISVR
jgi:hypothetical protein